MVIVNPRLSLPTDLPYKKRQRPFYANTPLQQATIRYNEAIRKKYNDTQFAKRLENGIAAQNETLGVNTIDISKVVDPVLFSEMSGMNPLSIVKKRRSKRFDVSPPGYSSSGDTVGSNARSSRHALDNTQLPSTRTSAVEEAFPIQSNNSNPSYDCNNTEMFPHLQTTVNTEGEKANNASHFAPNIKPPSTSSLEAQAINEYEPTIDSAHDMIFGNVMGLDYGNYIHGPLWTPQHGCGNNANGSNEQAPAFHNSPPNICCSPKLNPGGGYIQIQAQASMHSAPPPAPVYDINSNVASENASSILINPLTNLTKHGGPGRRSTSVPRPRTGTQKETLKQAAIRCGIIKGNIAAIPKRSHCLVPLHLAPVQSDPVVSVVEIFHPKGTLPACSSDALVEFEDFKFRTIGVDSSTECSEVFVIPTNKSTPALNIADDTNQDSSRIAGERSNSDGQGQVSTENSPIPVYRTMENAISCPTL